MRSLDILIIDDNLDLAEALALELRLLGHEVATASAGKRGLVEAAQRSPDLIFVDISLPDMDGFEVAEELGRRTATSSATLIAFTGWARGLVEERAAAAGFDRLIVKPITKTDVTQLLNEVSAEVPTNF